MKKEADLREAQKYLVKEITETAGGIAVLGMGGGKTAAILTAHRDLKTAGIIDKTLVFAPPRVVVNVWPYEAAKWEHLQDISVVAAIGTAAARKKVLHRSDVDVIAVSHQNVQSVMREVHNGTLGGTPLDRVNLVIDEITKIGSPRSTNGQALFKNSSKFAGCWGLTGTPRPNGYEDLWAPIRIVSGRRDVWGTFTKVGPGGVTREASDFDTWRDRHFYKLDYQGFQWAPHEFVIPELNKVASEWMVRPPASPLHLPPLNTGEDFVRWTNMSPEQDQLYQEMMENLYVQGRSQGLDGRELEDWIVDACSRGVASGKLTQIVQGFLYLDGDTSRYHTTKENPKLDMLSDMDSNLGYDRSLVIYGYRQEIDVLKKLFSHRTIGMIGSGVSDREMHDTIQAWNKGEVDRLLLHPASGGHGLELQFGGHHLIWYHPTWSAENYSQTIKRVHRPGQDHEVFNWQIAMRGTNDEIKLSRVARKIEEEKDFCKMLG